MDRLITVSTTFLILGILLVPGRPGQEQNLITKGGTDVYADVDNVFVIPAPIFSDCFESGTTSAWYSLDSRQTKKIQLANKRG